LQIVGDLSRTIAFLEMTGSGKTYTMQPLPLRACEDIMAIMQQPSNRNQGFQLWLSFFENNGGKLYDLLNERRCGDLANILAV
jgi:hypothetical protein